MVFREKFLALIAFAMVTLFVQSSKAQEDTRAVQSAKKVEPPRSTRAPGPFKPNPFAQSLRQSHRAFAAAPPADLASELAEAALPVISKKEYSLAGLSGVRFLSHPRFEPREFRNFSAPGLNTSKLRDAKHPDLSKVR
jgi:hypothetical protein